MAVEVHESIRYCTDRDIKLTARPYWRAPPRLLVSDFADQELIVTSGPLASGKWRTSFMPYQRGILDAFFEPGVEYVVVQASSQVGKTTAAVVLVAYHMAHDPCTILVVEPTVKPMAEDFSKNRLEPIIDASPILRETVSKKRSKDSQNTTLAKAFKGGSLSIGGANSAASLAARTIRFLVLDEVERYPYELAGEGSTIQIAIKRTAAYGSQRRVFISSSPTLKGGPIDVWYERGDQRRYHVPCPSCGYMHAYQWKNVVWENDDPATARLRCPACDYRITNAERVAVLEKGEWRPAQTERADKSIVSFHIWEAYSPLSSLSQMVADFLFALKAKDAGDSSRLHTWMNTTLGEAIEPYIGEKIDSRGLLLRKESYGDFEVPGSVACLTMSIDTQDDRLEVLITGWGPGEEAWFVDRHVLDGDTSASPLDTTRATPWTHLDELLDRTYRHPAGNMQISATCIDSGGHRTERVYEWVYRHQSRRVFAIIGRSDDRPLVSSPSLKRWGRGERQVSLYTIGIDAAKRLLFDRLKVEEPGPGYIHFPSVDWCDDEFARQLTSERLVTKRERGRPKQVWEPVRARNEALDLYVYGLAALRLLNPGDLRLVLERLRNPDTVAAPAARPRRRVGRSKYLGR